MRFSRKFPASYSLRFPPPEASLLCPRWPAYHPEVGLAAAVLPLLVQLSRVVCLERLLPEAHLQRELRGQLAHEQRVPRVIEHGARHGSSALDPPQTAHGANVLRVSVGGWASVTGESG